MSKQQANRQIVPSLGIVCGSWRCAVNRDSAALFGIGRKRHVGSHQGLFLPMCGYMRVQRESINMLKP